MMGQATVLVVGDERGRADRYARWLSEHEVRTACTWVRGREAFDASVDVVLLDRSRPDGSGDELPAEVRSAGSHCRVAMLAAADTEIDVPDLPVDECLRKPVSERDLRETVDQLLAIHEYEEAARERFLLAKRMAFLETHTPESELGNDERYTALASRLDELETLLDSRATALGDAGFRLLYRGADRMEPPRSAAPADTRVKPPVDGRHR